MDMQKPIRVVIIDDHQVFVDALAVRLADDPDFQVVGKATSSEQALDVLSSTPCDVVTLDLLLAGRTAWPSVTRSCAAGPRPAWWS